MSFCANTAPDGLFCKMWNIRIIFVGTGVPDGPRDVKQNKPLRVVFELYQGSIREDTMPSHTDWFNFKVCAKVG